jgi:hypothetical protein
VLFERSNSADEAFDAAAEDEFEANAVTCLDCGTRWDPQYHDGPQPWAAVDECPRCGYPLSEITATNTP